MGNLEYYVPPIPKRLFRIGDKVEVLNRTGDFMRKTVVTKIGLVAIDTEDGLQWSHRGWWWDGGNAYPFPSIRLTTPPTED